MKIGDYVRRDSNEPYKPYYGKVIEERTNGNSTVWIVEVIKDIDTKIPYEKGHREEMTEGDITNKLFVKISKDEMLVRIL